LETLEKIECAGVRRLQLQAVLQPMRVPQSERRIDPTIDAQSDRRSDRFLQNAGRWRWLCRCFVTAPRTKSVEIAAPG